MESKKTFCVDIDGTICTHTGGMYAKAEPLKERIEQINKLYDMGHKIVFFTARGMKRFNGDVTTVKEIFYDFTVRQLELWGCKYHELILGKPEFDLMIDDKAIHDSDFFNYAVRNYLNDK
jgi:capsule biosynthesis phosphatase